MHPWEASTSGKAGRPFPTLNPASVETRPGWRRLGPDRCGSSGRTAGGISARAMSSISGYESGSILDMAAADTNGGTEYGARDVLGELYQLMAVKKVMESLRQRFLIADDVGLGKTIEAGLIMQELTARQRGTRVLVIVPASLQDQWKKEMQRHFLRTFYIYNSRKMEGIQELVDENLNPWLARNSIITSIDWIKPQYEGAGAGRRNTNRFYDQLMKVERRWDLVMIDESHYVSTDSNRSDLAKAIQERCDSLLLLTATPHSGNPEHFFNLLNLIDPFMFSDPENLDRSDARQRVEKVMIRRGKETIFEKNGAGQLIKKFKERDVHPVQIPFTTEEDELYKAVSGYTGDGWAELSRKRKISAADLNIGKFLLALVQKRMVSRSEERRVGQES